MKWDVIGIIVSVCSLVAAFLTRDLYMGKMWGTFVILGLLIVVAWGVASVYSCILNCLSNRKRFKDFNFDFDKEYKCSIVK